MRTKREGVQAANGAINSYRTQVDDLQEEQQSIRNDISKIEQKVDDLRTHLARNILINVSEEEVARVSTELSLPTLNEQLAASNRKRDENIRRQEEILNTQEFRDRELLIHPVTGEYTAKITELSESLIALEQSVKKYTDIRGFKKLYARKDKPAPTGIIKFLRTITLIQYFASRIYERRKENVLHELKKTTLGSVFYEYDEVLQAYNITKNEHHRFVALKQRVERLIEVNQELTEEISGFEQVTLEKLRKDILAHLKLITVNKELREQVRKGVKVIVTSLIAQEEKMNYLEQMDNYLSEEILDRENRIMSISSVARKWSKKPYDRLRGNKTKWLITVPKMKSASTGKRVKWIKTMRINISGFDHYDAYDYMLEHNDDFLPWDVFARASEERMPYEGFTAQVIPDIEEYRESHQEKADYGDIDLAIRESAESEENSDDNVVEDAAALAAVAYGVNEAMEAEEELTDEDFDTDVDIADES